MTEKKQFSSNRLILLDEERMVKLDALLQQYCELIRYRGESKSSTLISFDSFEELMKYSNYGKDRLKSITLVGVVNRFDTVFEIILSPDIIYNKSVKCTYSFPDNEKQRLFESDLHAFIEKAGEYNCSFTACKIISWIILSCAFVYSAVEAVKRNGNYSVLILLAVGLLPMLVFIYLFLIKKALELLFPKVIFAWGEEARRYKRFITIRSNLFWVVIVGIGIACLSAILF